MKKILIICVTFLCLFMVGCDNGTTSDVDSSKVEKLTIIGKWRHTWEGNYWEFNFIDSSNYTLTATGYGWIGTGTYKLSDQTFEDGSRENTHIRELGKASFELDYEWEGTNQHMSWTADYIINSNQRVLYLFNYSGSQPFTAIAFNRQ